MRSVESIQKQLFVWTPGRADAKITKRFYLRKPQRVRRRAWLGSVTSYFPPLSREQCTHALAKHQAVATPDQTDGVSPAAYEQASL